jgi:hypothetical protein
MSYLTDSLDAVIEFCEREGKPCDSLFDVKVAGDAMAAELGPDHPLSVAWRESIADGPDDGGSVAA